MTKTTYTTKRTTTVKVRRGEGGRFMPKAAAKAKQPPKQPASQAKAPMPALPKQFSIKELDHRDDVSTVILQCDLAGLLLLFEVQKFVSKQA